MGTKDRVQNALTKVPALRDDVHLLIAVMHKTDLKSLGKDINTMTGAEVLDMQAEQKLTSGKSIDRFWRMIQKDHPELRGENWKQRTLMDEPDVREQMREHAKTA